jgi:hypothetical protein
VASVFSAAKTILGKNAFFYIPVQLYFSDTHHHGGPKPPPFLGVLHQHKWTVLIYFV